MADKLPSSQTNAQHQQQQQQLQHQLKMLGLGFVHLTGGMDSGNRPVLCFPPRQIIRMHLNNVAAPELTSIIDYLVSVAPTEAYPIGANRQARGLAFLADFRACSQSIFRIVIDALEAVQSHSPGSVGVFYVLMPRSKELAKSLQKMLGLYQKKTFLPSRKSGPDPNAKSFQSVLLPTSQELFQFVSKTNLMLDFGGSLNYDHEAWMKLRTSFDSLLMEVAGIADKAPEALQSLSDVPQQPAGDYPDETAVQESAHSMQDQFQRVTAALGLEAASEKVAQLLAACQDPKNYPETRPLAGNILLQSYIERLQRLQTRLEELKTLLRDRWKQSEAGLLVDGRLTGHKRAAVELGDWLERWGKEALKRADARAIANQQMAEDAREKLRMQVLEPSTAKLHECRTLLTKLRQLAAASPQRSVGREPNEAAQLVDQLEAKKRGFSERVKSAKEKLDRICDFFNACAKTLKWYQRCLKKLPLDLLQPSSHRGNHRLQSNEPLPIVAKWPEISRSFSLQHPSPTQAQLDELRETMSLIDDVEIRKEVQLLVHRTNLLRKLLASTPATVEGGITVGQYRELLEGRENQAEPDGDPAFASLEPSQSLAGSSDEAEFEASPARKVIAPSFQFPPERADDIELQRGGRFQRRTGRSVASSSGTEIVEVIPEPIVINHRLMARPPVRGFDVFDEKELRKGARKEEDDAFSRKAVTSLESLPKEETVRRYLENMVITPPPPLTATTDESLGSGSHMGRSLSNLVGELRDLKEALFYSGSRAQMAPVARRGRRFQTPHRQTHRQLLPPAVAGEMLRSRSEQNLASHAPRKHGEDHMGQRQRKLLLLQLDDPPSTRGVAYPVEVIDIHKIVGDIRDIASDRYRHQPHQKPPQYSSRNRLPSGEVAAAGYSMSRMSDTDPVLGNYSFDDLAGEGDLTRDMRPSRHSDNFLLTSPDNRPAGAGRSHSPRSQLMMSPPTPPSIPEEAVDAAAAEIAAERLRWRRRDNRMWLHNTYNMNSHH